MAQITQDQFDAWTVYFEVYGEESMKNVKPSSLKSHNIDTAQQIISSLVSAYRARSVIFATAKVGLKSIFRPPSSVSGLARIILKWYQKGGKEIFNRDVSQTEAVEMVNKLGMIRVIAMRAHLPDLVGGEESGGLIGFDSAAAHKEISRLQSNNPFAI